MRVSTSFQSPFLISYLSVIENVYFPLMLKGVKDKETIALDCLKRVSLEDKKERDVISLSGGEKMRVSIARALTLDSEILLFDEPTGELDDKTSLEIFKLLKQLASDHIVIIVTHDRRYAIELADFIYEVKDKTLVLLKSKEKKNMSKKEMKDGKMKIKDMLFLVRKYLSTKKLRLIFSTIFLSLLLSFLYLGINIYTNKDNIITELSSNYLDANVYKITKEEVIVDGDNIDLKKNSLPSNTEMKGLGISSYYPSYSYFILDSIIYKDQGINLYPCFQKAENLKEGRAIEKYYEVIINPLLAKLVGDDIIGETIYYHHDFFLEEENMMMSIDLDLTIVGISDEYNLFNFPSLYYDYSLIGSYLKNIKTEAGDLYSLLNDEPYRGTYYLFLNEDISKIETTDEFIISSKSIDTKNDVIEIVSSLFYIVLIFLSLALLASFFAILLVIFSLYDENILFLVLIKIYSQDKKDLYRLSMMIYFLILIAIETISFSSLATLIINILLSSISLPSFLTAFSFLGFLFVSFITLLFSYLGSLIAFRKIKDERIKSEMEGEE